MRKFWRGFWCLMGFHVMFWEFTFTGLPEYRCRHCAYISIPVRRKKAE